MTTDHLFQIATDLSAIATSPKFLLAVFVFIVLPTSLVSLIPRLSRTLSYPRGPSLEGLAMPSRFWLVMIDVVRFVAASTGQAIIGAIALLLLRQAGINLL